MIYRGLNPYGTSSRLIYAHENLRSSFVSNTVDYVSRCHQIVKAHANGKGPTNVKGCTSKVLDAVIITIAKKDHALSEFFGNLQLAPPLALHCVFAHT